MSPRRAPLSPEETERWLDERTVRSVRAVDTIGSAEGARLLGLGSREAVHARLGSGHLVGDERPVARLRAGDVEAVVAAARSEGQGDFH